MPLTPTDWSVVVVGHWNRAILTPSGIAKRLFGLDKGTPIEVFVAIDALAPPRVKHDGIVVTVGGDRLIAEPETSDFNGLERAMEIGRRAVKNLPETPVLAAGMNVKYSCKEPLESLQNITRHLSWDDQLSDNNYEILARALSRELKWKEGQINFSLTEESDSTFQLQFNFHRGGTSVDDLAAWLSTPQAELESQVKRILFDCIQINTKDLENAAADAKA
ncbi:MAG: hypothetical protein ACYC35_04270 [Pirellulales bacterium]